MHDYKRPFVMRFARRHSRRLHWLLFTFLPSAATALVFSLFFVATLLHLGAADTSGRAAGDSLSIQISSNPVHPNQQATRTPGPGSYVSGASLDLAGGR